MWASRPANECQTSRDLTLDEASFQKLLAAAWTIQCERDRLRAGSVSLPVAFDLSAFPHHTPDQTHKPALAEARGSSRDFQKQSAAGIQAMAKFPPTRVEPVRSPETVGALALAPQPRAIPGAGRHDCPDGVLGSTSRQTVRPESPGSILTVVSSPKLKRQSSFDAIAFLRSTPAAVLFGSILVLLTAIGILTFGVGHYGRRLSSPEGPSLSLEHRTAGAANLATSAALPESSHRRVTDSSISAELEELSGYEIGAIRRQAEFGDDHAALILAMAHELGQGTPQNCTEAAHWVLAAAQNGNAAAQYNLGLRFIYGDGVSASQDDARRWLQASANLGYDKAHAALLGLR